MKFSTELVPTVPTSLLALAVSTELALTDGFYRTRSYWLFLLNSLLMVVSTELVPAVLTSLLRIVATEH